jgi:hypothetical protein
MARPFASSITLSEADRAVPVGWTRRQTTAQALALRARVMLAAAEPGTTNPVIAQRFGITMLTVGIGIAIALPGPRRRAGSVREMRREPVRQALTPDTRVCNSPRRFCAIWDRR